MARFCKLRTMAKSNRAGQPPGVAAYSVELDLNDTAQLRELADSTAGATTAVTVCSMALGDGGMEPPLGYDGMFDRDDGEPGTDGGASATSSVPARQTDLLTASR